MKGNMNKVSESKLLNKVIGMRYPRCNDILKSLKNRLAEPQQHSNNINQESRAWIYISSLPLKDERYAIAEKLFCQFI